MSHLAKSGEQVRTPYKIDTGPIPLDVIAVNQINEPGGCWYRIPSWRVHFDCEALKGVDLRLHRSIASAVVWTLTEATTGFKIFGDIAHDQYIGDEGSMLAEFAAGRMLQLTPKKVAKAIETAKEILAKRPPNPFAPCTTPLKPGLRADIVKRLRDLHLITCMADEKDSRHTETLPSVAADIIESDASVASTTPQKAGEPLYKDCPDCGYSDGEHSQPCVVGKLERELAEANAGKVKLTEMLAEEMAASVASATLPIEITSKMEEAGMAIAKHDLGFGVTRTFVSRVFKAMRAADGDAKVEP